MATPPSNNKAAPGPPATAPSATGNNRPFTARRAAPHHAPCFGPLDFSSGSAACSTLISGATGADGASTSSAGWRRLVVGREQPVGRTPLDPNSSDGTPIFGPQAVHLTLLVNGVERRLTIEPRVTLL